MSIQLGHIVTTAFSDLVKKLMKENITAANAFKLCRWVKLCDEEISAFGHTYRTLKPEIEAGSESAKEQFGELLKTPTGLKLLPADMFKDVLLSAADALVLQPVLEKVEDFIDSHTPKASQDAKANK